MSARLHVASAALPSGSAVDAWVVPEVSPEHFYQTMPPLARDDAAALERSIQTHGIQTPILVDEAGNIIDGHHRREIAVRCGLPLPVEVRRGLDESTKVALSISLNVDRRQLTREQKRQLIATSIKAEPEATDREHARRTGATHPTVAAVRSELEASGVVERFTTRTDSLGRQQPASKPVVSIKHKIAEAVESSPEVQSARYVHEFMTAMTLAEDFLEFDPARVGRLSPEAITAVEHLHKSTESFLARMRPGLRLVKGGAE